MSDIDALREDERRASGEPKRPDTVTIPRAQYEALMAALEKHKLIARMQTSQHTTYADFSAAKHHAEEALRIARAAFSGKEE